MYIVIHCSDSPDSMYVDAELIHQWHMEKGYDGIGYHAVVKRDGVVEEGRPLYWQGAHVRGHNRHSIGICLVGRDSFTGEQMYSLRQYVEVLQVLYPNAQVLGHRDLDSKKTCPNFDVKKWWADE